MADKIIKFDANTGSGTMEKITIPVGEWTVIANDFTPPKDKQFKEWSDVNDGSGNKYQPGRKVTFDNDVELTLYAIWSDIPKIEVEKPPTTTEPEKTETETEVSTNTGTNVIKKVNAFALKKRYNFNSQPELSAIIGEKFTMFKVKSLMTAEEAVKYTDIVTLHTTCRPLIATLPDSIHDLTYVLFEDVNKNLTTLPLEYIDLNTILEVQSINIRLQLYDANTEDLTILKTTLLELGYANFKITTFE